jgi:hypothetical protein
MPPVFAQMGDDAVDSGEFGKHCCRRGLGLAALARLSYRCDMIDVH